ncbi:MAG: response regulator [Desulfobacterales bacterium]|nr:response regulator [Desulfobacterales bacterium]
MDRPKILIVENSSAIRLGLISILNKFGADVKQAINSRQGLEIAKAEHFDLIITDTDMPEMDGFEFCRDLKEQQSMSTPVIILGSQDNENEVEKGFSVGASAYINKIHAYRDLEKYVKELLKKSVPLYKRLIMVVDDSRSVRKFVREGLIREGFRVVTSCNGREGLEIIEEEKPDLILSDLNMPEMNGMAFYEALQTDSLGAGIPFVVMSVINDLSTMRHIMYKGAVAYLVKPFNIEQLIITIEKMLSDRYQVLLREKERFTVERNLMLGSISSLIRALEARDNYTMGHSDFVAKMVVGMACRMNFSPQEIEDIDIAAKLHDIGKIGLKDDLLLKPDKLTDEEFETVKRHPVIGAEILLPIPSLKEMIPAVLYHHERLDGKGYPDGLKGSDLPLWARMIAVADTYHALVSDRPYRNGKSHENALQTISEVAGTQLCPECIRVFMEWIETQESSYLKGKAKWL